jgi:hypothetical protein
VTNFIGGGGGYVKEELFQNYSVLADPVYFLERTISKLLIPTALDLASEMDAI